MADKPSIISGASVNETLVKPVSRSMRLDKELNQMLKRLLVQLQDYETKLGPLVDQARIAKGQVKASLSPGQKLTNQELKRLIGEKLTSMGADASLDTSTGNFRDLGRAISSLLATNPGAMGDIIEESLSAAGKGDLKEAGKVIARYQKGLVELNPFMVGHHEQGLRGYRTVLEYLEKLPNQNLRQNVLHILERKYGANFGEEGLRYLFPFSHTASDIGPLGSTKPTARGGVRKDIRVLFDEAFPNLGGFHNLDQINPNLRKLIEPLIAHSKAARGTHGFIAPLEKIKGLTDPNEIAEALLYYVDANRASYTNAKALHEVIWKHGIEEITLPDGTIKTVLKKSAWANGGVLQQAIEKIPITSVAPESGWGVNRLITKPREVVTEVSDRAIKEVSSSAADPTRAINPWNIFNFQSSGNGTAVLDATTPNFMTGVNQASAELVGNVDNAVGKIFSNDYLNRLNVKTQAWLLNQGPSKIATRFATEYGIGTAVGTLVDENQRQRLGTALFSNEDAETRFTAGKDFVFKSIEDELWGQAMWHGGKAVLPQGVRSAVGTTVSTGAKIAKKASPYALAASVGGSTIQPEYRPENRWEKAGFPSEQQYNMAVNELKAEDKGDMHVSYHTANYESYMNRKSKLEKDRFIPSENESLFSTNAFTQP